MDPPLPPSAQLAHPPPTTVVTTADAPPQHPASIPPPTNSNHIAHAAAANATTSTIPTTPFNHPPYSDMIFAAITALKERDGSSKRAIAKYIDKAFTGLPPAHSALLAHHLKRLRNNGQLLMVKKSYKIPRSDDPVSNNIAAAPPPTASGAPASMSTTSTYPHPQPQVSGPAGPKRGRGRPPKYKPNDSPGYPATANGQPISQPVLTDAQPVLVSLGLADDPIMMAVKRGRGRPKKAAGVGEGGTAAAKKGRGRPSKSALLLGPKKSPGRPRKPKSVGVKKAPGRPRKSQQQSSGPFAAAATGNAAAAAAAPATSGGGSGGFHVPKPRGRPKKVVGQVVGNAGVVVPAKRPGRPPKMGGIMKPKKSTGRPVGRPKKNANPSWTVVEASQSQSQAEVIGDLKRKFEFVQSRVKLAVGLLRPHLAGAAINAIVAIQELEGIAALDINSPLREEAQPQTLPQQLPQPPPSPQPQVFQN